MKNTEIFNGLIIRAESVADNDVRIRVFTENGIRTLTVVGALKPNAKLKSATQLFTLAEFTVAGSRVIGLYVQNTNHTIAHDIKRYYLACAICEVLDQIYRHTDEPNPTAFALTVKAFYELGEGSSSLGGAGSFGCSTSNMAETKTSKATSPRQIFTDYFTALLVDLGYDIPDDMDLNTAYIHNLDIKIPHTNRFL